MRYNLLITKHTLIDQCYVGNQLKWDILIIAAGEKVPISPIRATTIIEEYGSIDRFEPLHNLIAGLVDPLWQKDPFWQKEGKERLPTYVVAEALKVLATVISKPETAPKLLPDPRSKYDTLYILNVKQAMYALQEVLKDMESPHRIIEFASTTLGASIAAFLPDAASVAVVAASGGKPLENYAMSMVYIEEGLDSELAFTEEWLVSLANAVGSGWPLSGANKRMAKNLIKRGVIGWDGTVNWDLACIEIGFYWGEDEVQRCTIDRANGHTNKRRMEYLRRLQ